MISQDDAGVFPPKTGQAIIPLKNKKEI